MVGHGHGGLPGQHEIDVEPGLLEELLEVGEEGQAALHAVDAPHVEHEGPLETVSRREVEEGIGIGQVETAADDRARHGVVAADSLHELLLLGGQVDDAPGALEEGLEDPQVDGGVVLGGGHEKGLLAHSGQAGPGVVVAVAIEEEEVEPVLRACDRPHEIRRERPVLAYPGFLFGARVVIVKDHVAERGEDPGIAAALHGEAVHGKAANQGAALRIVVPPLEVVEGSGGEDLDLVATGQALGQEPAMHFRSPVDLEAVALDDESEPHAAAAPPAATRASRVSHFSRTTGQEWCAAR